MYAPRYRIGWVIDARWPYINTMASTRIRCLDIIGFLKARGVQTEIYKPFKKYDAVIFQKSFSDRHLKIARKASAGGSKIILDINVNYFEKSGETTQVTSTQIEDLHRFLELTDEVLVSSMYLRDIAERYHPSITYIPEHISTVGPHPPKKLSSPVKLLYCGYAVKADSILFILDVLRELSGRYDLEMIFVCDKDPSLTLPVTSRFIKYQHKGLAPLLRQGDIKLAPRKLDNSYDLGHSFTKIGYPMSVGLPVVASPVPSYKNTPARIAHTAGEWLEHLIFLFENPQEFENVSQEGIQYVQDNHSIEKIGQIYLDFLDRICNG